MLVNSSLEQIPSDRDFQQLIATVLREVESFFLRCVIAGQRDGTVTASQPADDLARMLLGQLLGIRVLAKVKPERKLLEGMIRRVVAMLFDGTYKSVNLRR